MELSTHLQKTLGLTDQESRVYVAGLASPESTVQDLANSSGVKRTSIYSFIESMLERGFLVRKKRGKRFLYSAVDPKQLLEMERARLQELEDSVIPGLEAIHNSRKEKPAVLYFEGVEGIKEVYADMLKERQTIYELEDLEYIKKVLPKSFYEYFPAERARRNIELKAISRDSKVTKDFIKKDMPLLRETKLVESADWKTDINIYGNKVALMSFRTSVPYCVLIEDSHLADTLRTAWEIMWNAK